MPAHISIFAFSCASTSSLSRPRSTASLSLSIYPPLYRRSGFGRIARPDTTTLRRARRRRAPLAQLAAEPEARRPCAAPIAHGAEDRAQEPHAPTLLLQLLTPAALLAKNIKSTAALLDVPSTSAHSLHNSASERRANLFLPNFWISDPDLYW